MMVCEDSDRSSQLVSLGKLSKVRAIVSCVEGSLGGEGGGGAAGAGIGGGGGDGDRCGTPKCT
eukprot:5204008-Pleurochrysis_carterae.AAC.1